jgi:L-amino acid N-acyltransferase YncA
MFAAPAREEIVIDGCQLQRREVDGTVEVAAVDDEGTTLGLVRIHARAHGDAFYGRYSRNDDHYVYGSKLEISPQARGRGMGNQMLAAARWVAYDETGLGLKSLVAPDNAISLRCHAAVGFDPPVAELNGIRIGPRVLWWSRRPLDP